MTEILFARKIDVDALTASIAGLVTVQNTLATADFLVGTAQAGLGAERVVLNSTSILVNTGVATQVTWERAALTGDITAPQNSNATTLATVNANVGSFGSSAQVPTFTVNGKGLITAAGNVNISITASQVTDFTEASQDVIGALLVDSGRIDYTYNDAGNAMTTDIVTNSIDNTRIRQGVARSVIGVTGNATANVADIQGTTDQVLVVNTAGTALTFATVATGGLTNNAVTFAKFQQIATDRLVGRDTAGTGNTEEVAVTNGLEFSGGTAIQMSANQRTIGIEYVIDGGGATITTGIKGDLEIPFACTIQQATLLADQSGSIVVNVWKQVYASYPPTVAQKITASAPPTISATTKSQDATLTGWTTSITAGDTLRFNVDSVTTIQRVTLSLKCLKT